ncbi:translation elongation factor Ts [Buchananella hordeovulneris]|uniref:Elongation factor Ts n=1 Tax=Buchananella hordeovulneris TaxID=52770 RepID=A0A1Q5PX75_9ACTO|nr:translation elongation factor Ts [Buchananella hordeovulneris]MDO5080353.1 translation elongation factor Ts [Buchananella hordeovulneris]OKL52157.1 translation elongation factor Ts [Buchananella hordeovulneris]RRD44905.1 elongation factor Ts [Buchananella hordeovulneris]RRD52489.1 elongation factor Ts [Buchananella hordeovulneris]
MANYTLADIKALREKTGAGMMDVKKALEEAAGDLDKAVEIIRVKGLKGLTKREGRAASAGLVVAEVVEKDGQKIGYLVELNSETDFVAKNEKFIDFAGQVLAAAVAADARDLESLLAAEADGRPVKDLVDEIASVIGEKIVVRRVARVSGPEVSVYLHRTAKDLPPQVGVLVASCPAAAEAAHDVAMHIAAYSPKYLSRDEVPVADVEAERKVLEDATRAEGKPEAALPKIVEGKLNGFFKEIVLLDQPFAKDPKMSVGKFVEATGGQITGFARFRVGA